MVGLNFQQLLARDLRLCETPLLKERKRLPEIIAVY
jgi:hypothetical protein